jgi:glycosyltransferase involved in cell wall biosynthesis
MEAAAMGVPCVATDIRGCRQAVDPERSGRLVARGDVQGLADAILDILKDKAIARRMGSEGRRLALERFDEQKVFATVKAEYARLIMEKSRSGVALRPCPVENSY